MFFIVVLLLIEITLLSRHYNEFYILLCVCSLASTYFKFFTLTYYAYIKELSKFTIANYIILSIINIICTFIIAVMVLWTGFKSQYITFYIPAGLFVYQLVSNSITTFYQIYMYKNRENKDTISNITFKANLIIYILLSLLFIFCIIGSIACIIYGFWPIAILNTRYQSFDCTGEIEAQKRVIINRCYLWTSPYYPTLTGPSTYDRWTLTQDFKYVDVTTGKTCDLNDLGSVRIPTYQCYNSTFGYSAKVTFTKYHMIIGG